MEPIKNNDAYMLMEYTCEQCGTVEKIWNSRNNVSPFLVECRACEGTMKHTNWRNDKRIADYEPPKGSRYFADMTPRRAREIAEDRVKAGDGTRYELEGEKRDAMVEQLAEALVSDEGSMDLLEA